MGFIQGIGPLELAIIALIVLVIVGGKRLPRWGRQLGEGAREFKDSLTRKTDAHYGDTSRDQGQAALGRPAEEQSPLDGEVMRERK
jgi:sec-independent protein translocase protein TatA